MQHIRFGEDANFLRSAVCRKGVAFRDPLAVLGEGIRRIGISQPLGHILADEPARTAIRQEKGPPGQSDLSI